MLAPSCGSLRVRRLTNLHTLAPRCLTSPQLRLQKLKPPQLLPPQSHRQMLSQQALLVSQSHLVVVCLCRLKAHRVAGWQCSQHHFGVSCPACVSDVDAGYACSASICACLTHLHCCCTNKRLLSLCVNPYQVLSGCVGCLCLNGADLLTTTFFANRPQSQLMPVPVYSLQQKQEVEI